MIALELGAVRTKSRNMSCRFSDPDFMKIKSRRGKADNLLSPSIDRRSETHSDKNQKFISDLTFEKSLSAVPQLRTSRRVALFLYTTMVLTRANKLYKNLSIIKTTS